MTIGNTLRDFALKGIEGLVMILLILSIMWPFGGVEEFIDVITHEFGEFFALMILYAILVWSDGFSEFIVKNVTTNMGIFRDDEQVE